MTANPNSELLTVIDRFLASTGMSETYFGFRAVNDGKYVSRLREGGRTFAETADKVRAFIEAGGEPLAPKPKPKPTRKPKRRKKTNGHD